MFYYICIYVQLEAAKHVLIKIISVLSITVMSFTNEFYDSDECLMLHVATIQ